MNHTIFLLASLLLFLHSHADGKVKVFILSGELNMSGGGHVVEEGLQFDAAVGAKVQIWHACDYWGKQGNALPCSTGFPMRGCYSVRTLWCWLCRDLNSSAGCTGGLSSRWRVV